MAAKAGESSPHHVPPLRLVFWESTARCNLACRHCRRLDDSRRLARWDLATAEVLRLIGDLQTSHPGTVLVFSGGEPLLREDLFDLVAAARGAHLTTALATNGTLVTEELAGRIAGAGFARVSISLDGARAETHDAIRGIPGAFDEALRGLRLLAAAGQQVQINMSIMRANAGELEDMFRLAEAESGAVALHIFIVVPVGCGMKLGPEARLSPDEYERLLREFIERSAASSLATKATCAPQYARITRELQSETGSATVPGGPLDSRRSGCLAGSGVCFVGHTGDVFPCGYLPVRCGNVRESPLSEIWRTSKVLARLRDPDALKGKCGACDHRMICGGCRARAFAATGDYLVAEPDCGYRPPR